MNQDEIKTNLLDTNQWIRILFMAGFAVAAWLVLLALVVLVLVQTLIVLVSGEANHNLRKVAYLFGCYLQELVEYLSYNRNDKPFPFADFPQTDERDTVADVAQQPDATHSGATPEGHSPAPFHHSPEAGDDQDSSPR
jgi:hypothetical protein